MDDKAQKVKMEGQDRDLVSEGKCHLAWLKRLMAEEVAARDDSDESLDTRCKIVA